MQIPFDYSFDRSGIVTDRRGVPADLFDAGVLEPIMTEADLARLHALLDERDCVWLVYSHDWCTDPQQFIPAALKDKLEVRDRRPFYGLEVQLYEKP